MTWIYGLHFDIKINLSNISKLARPSLKTSKQLITKRKYCEKIIGIQQFLLIMRKKFTFHDIILDFYQIPLHPLKPTGAIQECIH